MHSHDTPTCPTCGEPLSKPAWRSQERYCSKRCWYSRKRDPAEAWALVPAMPEEPEECWPVPTNRRDGYFSLSWEGQHMKLVVLLYKLTYGVDSIAPGQRLRHLCPRGENRACVRPSHQAPGTAKQNSEDMVRFGHSALGERNGQARLTRKLAEEIRARYWGGESQASLAIAYGVSFQNVHLIVRGKTWK